MTPTVWLPSALVCFHPLLPVSVQSVTWLAPASSCSTQGHHELSCPCRRMAFKKGTGGSQGFHAPKFTAECFATFQNIFPFPVHGTPPSHPTPSLQPQCMGLHFPIPYAWEPTLPPPRAWDPTLPPPCGRGPCPPSCPPTVSNTHGLIFTIPMIERHLTAHVICFRLQASKNWQGSSPAPVLIDRLVFPLAGCSGSGWLPAGSPASPLLSHRVDAVLFPGCRPSVPVSSCSELEFFILMCSCQSIFFFNLVVSAFSICLRILSPALSYKEVLSHVLLFGSYPGLPTAEGLPLQLSTFHAVSLTN